MLRQPCFSPPLASFGLLWPPLTPSRLFASSPWRPAWSPGSLPSEVPVLRRSLQRAPRDAQRIPPSSGPQAKERCSLSVPRRAFLGERSIRTCSKTAGWFLTIEKNGEWFLRLSGVKGQSSSLTAPKLYSFIFFSPGSTQLACDFMAFLFGCLKLTSPSSLTTCSPNRSASLSLALRQPLTRVQVTRAPPRHSRSRTFPGFFGKGGGGGGVAWLRSASAYWTYYLSSVCLSSVSLCFFGQGSSTSESDTMRCHWCCRLILKRSKGRTNPEPQNM